MGKQNVRETGTSTNNDSHDDLQPDDPASASAHSTAASRTRLRPHGQAILGLVYDPVAQDLLMEIAIERGYGLFCATGAEEASRLLAEDPPSLLVIDVDFPDGRVLLSTLRAHPRWRLIPVLALTGTNNPMMAVSVDAPVFFKPELVGLEQAVAGRFDGTGAEGVEEEDEEDEEETMPWLLRNPSA